MHYIDYEENSTFRARTHTMGNCVQTPTTQSKTLQLRPGTGDEKSGSNGLLEEHSSSLASPDRGLTSPKLILCDAFELQSAEEQEWMLLRPALVVHGAVGADLGHLRHDCRTNHVHDHEYGLILCAEFVRPGSTGNPKSVALLRSERERKYDQVVE